MISVCSLSPCSWRNAAVGWRVHTAASCVHRSGLPVDIIRRHTHNQTLVKTTSVQHSPKGVLPAVSIITRPLTRNVDLKWALLSNNHDLKQGVGTYLTGKIYPTLLHQWKHANRTCHKRMVLPALVSINKLDTGSAFLTIKMWERCTATVNPQGNVNISNKR